VRRTRIVATLGPASQKPATLDQMVEAGVDAFRLNFSHGTEKEHRATLRSLRSLGLRSHREFARIADLQGPKIRLGELSGGRIQLSVGAEWRLDNSPEPGNELRASVTLPDVAGAARRADPILLGDGGVELTAVRRDGQALITQVVHGGPVSSNTGLFLPNARLRGANLGSKDLEDLAVALEEGVDYVALSFVRDADDVHAARKHLGRAGHPEVGLIAKIERAEALAHLEPILGAADAIMVARGDLGIEVPLERLALEQKRIVRLANAAALPVIVATQVLLSMVASPRPTRAEATDVANAVLDGADAVMLSEESAIGAYPVESVRWLDRICRTTEEAAFRGEVGLAAPGAGVRMSDASVAAAAVDLSRSLSASAIVVPTSSGRTARLVAGHRPSAPVFALSAERSTRRRLALTWGVETEPSPPHLSLLELRRLAVDVVRAKREVPADGPIVVTAGFPVEGRPTNLVTLVEPGSAPARRGSSGPTGRRSRVRRGRRRAPRTTDR
jgi:pyruvate kinase